MARSIFAKEDGSNYHANEINNKNRANPNLRQQQQGTILYFESFKVSIMSNLDNKDLSKLVITTNYGCNYYVLIVVNWIEEALSQTEKSNSKFNARHF